MNWPAVIAGALASGSAIYAWLAARQVQAWLTETAPSESSPGDLPPVTLLRPLKAGVPALRAKLDALIAAMHPGDQLILGADDGSVEMGVCVALRDSFPKREIVVVACRSGAALNPKISKLVQMTPHARHGHWLLRHRWP